MSIRKVNLVNLVFILLFLISCKDQGVIYPAQPQIEFENIVFEERQLPMQSSLFITFSITDGDLDFGLEMYQTDFPYQFADLFLKKDGSRISMDKLERGEVLPIELIQAKDRASAPFDTLPDPSTSCKYLRYTYGVPPNDVSNHQLYADRNENFSNLVVKLLLKEPDGSFIEVDPLVLACEDFNTRIPPLSNLSAGQEHVSGPLKMIMHSRQKGQITYEISSHIFRVLKSRILKARFYVKDRALNTSNVVETDNFAL